MKHIIISCRNIKTHWLLTKREIKIYLKTGSLIDFFMTSIFIQMNYMWLFGV